MHIGKQHRSSKSERTKLSQSRKTNPKTSNPVNAVSPSSNIRIIRSFATAAILIQSMIIYPFVLLNRLRGPQQTWSWSKCTAVHNSMAAYTMSTDLGMYLVGFHPMICFLLCRVTLCLESVLSILIHFVPFGFEIGIIIKWDITDTYVPYGS